MSSQEYISCHPSSSCWNRIIFACYRWMGAREVWTPDIEEWVLDTIAQDPGISNTDHFSGEGFSSQYVKSSSSRSSPSVSCVTSASPLTSWLSSTCYVLWMVLAALCWTFSAVCILHRWDKLHTECNQWTSTTIIKVGKYKSTCYHQRYQQQFK